MTKVLVSNGMVVGDGGGVALMKGKVKAAAEKRGDPDCDEKNSPLIVDFSGKGIQLSSREQGVWFDITGTGQRHPTNLD
jgi:hypothetical protein